MANTNYVKFLRGTPSAYASLETKDSDTLYFITATDASVGKLYLGDVLVAGNVTPDGTSIIDTLGELTDVNLSGLKDGQLLGYNGTNWVPMSPETAFSVSVMSGATALENGESGLVPAPKAGDQDKFLKGDGTWATIEVQSGTQVFEVEIEAKADHIEAINGVVGETTLQTGDIAIVKEVISGDKRAYTAYVYDKTWKAMDGNYSAANTYLSEDIVVTTKTGELAEDSTLKAGESISDVLTRMLSQSKNPSKTNPSLSKFTVTNNGMGTDFEVGTTITPKWTVFYSNGSYSYKSTVAKDPIIPVTGTGVVANSWSVKADGVEIGTTQNGTGEAFVLGDNAVTYQITVNYSDGNYALTNLNKLPETDVKIAAGSVSATTAAKITSYRKMFAGGVADSTTELTSAVIRGLGTGVKTTTDATEFKANVGDTKLIFAFPATMTGTPKFEYFTMSWEDFDGFAKEEGTVQVADSRGEANGLKEYNIYSYTPAGAFKAETKFRVSF